MELRHLRYFAAVAADLNFTRAAARLHVAQPALSRQIRQLEDELGVALLTRSPRGVQLTKAGGSFLEEARALQVALFETILKNLEQIGIGQLAGTLMAIADEVNAQLLQSLSGYENEKPVAFTENDLGARSRETVEAETSRRQEIAESTVKVPEAGNFLRKLLVNRPQS